MYNVDEYQRGIQKLGFLGYSLIKEICYDDFKHDFTFNKMHLFDGIYETRITINIYGVVNKFTTYHSNSSNKVKQEPLTSEELEAVELLIKSNEGDC